MPQPSLPPIADIQALTDALHRAGALTAGRVASVTVEASYPTVLSHIFRLRPAYDGAASDAPATLILKAGLLDRPGGPWFAGRMEVAFYAEVGAATPAGLTPRCFDAHWDQATGAWHLLLEDLTDSHQIATAWPVPPSIADSERIVRTRARFQAAWWDDPRLGTTVGTWPDAAAAAQGMRRLAGQYAAFADALGDRLSAERRQLYERVFEQAERLGARARARRHMTIIQGDSHVWNCFLTRSGALDDARLFDWDAWRIDVGSDDLAYMMALHWYPDLRQRAETRLLHAFHDELLARGVQGYDRRALQDDYRLSTLWQIMTPVWHHAVGIPPVIWWNNLERIHLAAGDLGCRELLAAS
ncbi:MAG: aminoglycoside phosphotransferase [Alphaproteobacteria bacterium]|nr:aminoglycoside phosphotransferase [Alphaproteobacteria bacterium]